MANIDLKKKTKLGTKCGTCGMFCELVNARGNYLCGIDAALTCEIDQTTDGCLNHQGFDEEEGGNIDG